MRISTNMFILTVLLLVSCKKHWKKVLNFFLFSNFNNFQTPRGSNYFFEIQEASVIESSNTNESLATSATSQPMEVDVDETAAESTTDEAGKPRPDQVEEDAKGRAGSGAEASAAKLRVGGAKDDASKVLPFSFCFF